MLTVYKYAIGPQDEQEIVLPVGAEILCVQVQNGKPYIWALVNPDLPEEKCRLRLVGTGHIIDNSDWNLHNLDYIGTFQLRGGALVFHLFEIVG